ncbi:MAG: DUF1611 domain-containing protein, partial [Crenarchaeota archaeon]|nr:DUF1611 domain-containing protein [Thermoproteota archaeon]
NPMRVVKIAKLLSDAPLIGIGLNHEKLSQKEAENAKVRLHKRFKVPVEDPVFDGVSEIVNSIEKLRDR